MFAKFTAPLLALSALAGSVVASPLRLQENTIAKRHSSPSFDNWHGLSSLNNFDGWYGKGNFDNSDYKQVFVKHDESLVCHSQTISIIQQRLVVLQEMAKRIITEQICDVETQTIVFEQYHASLGGFSRDLRHHHSGHRVGYDTYISGYYGRIVGSDGSLTYDDYGFNGNEVGSHYDYVDGSNWNNDTSYVSVGDAYGLAKSAYVSQD
jgi:hypothetical protein